MQPSTTTRPDGPQGYYQQVDRRPEYFAETPRAQPPPMGYRQSIDLPRPLEPRPSSYQQYAHPPEHAAAQARPGAHEAYTAQTNGYRPSGQTLPGLRDILPPTSRHSPHSSQQAWAPPPASAPPSAYPAQEQRPREAPHSYPHPPMNLHPPHALPPPSERPAPHPVHGDRRLDLPILETQPIPRQAPPASVPVSPYAVYPENGRDYIDARHHERQRQASTSSYMTNSAPSPYTPLTTDESHRSSASSYDRAGLVPPFTPTGPEASKKYLGVKEFAGEGAFHLYEGGYRIPTHVDGEQVNPQWGLTKANKPRKRLALACLDCREKKIKCEPGASSCLQCEKAKRVCRRAPNQHPPNEASNGTTWPAAPSEASPPHIQPVERVIAPSPQMARGIEPATPNVKRMSEQDSYAKRRAPEDLPASIAPAKKHCSASPTAAINGTPVLAQQPQYQHPAILERAPRPPLPTWETMTWDDDPFRVDRDITMRLLDFYFAHVNNVTYGMLPRHAFLHWVRTNTEKTANERMALYAFLAMGSVFAGDAFEKFGKRCADIAMGATLRQLGWFSVPLVQSRLMLGFYNFAMGNEGAAWDYCGLALRAISAMRYNEEEGCLEPDQKPDQKPRYREYGFSKEQITECRRRAFWSGFLMDRYNGFCGGMLSVVNPSDIYLRLPCADDRYENSMPSDAPFFNNTYINPTDAILTSTSPVANMAWLVLVAALWGDAMNFIYRAQHHAPDHYRAAYERLYQDIYTSMHGWTSRLPEHLRYSESNLDRSIQGGYAGIFISIHVLHHFVLMKLNRCMRHPLAMDVVPRNIVRAHDHADQILRIMCAIQSARRDIARPFDGQFDHFVFSTPFPGFATLSAIDIVTAGGHDSGLGPTMDGMAGGLECLRELSQFWAQARKQFQTGETRRLQLKNVITRPYKANHGCWLGRNWGFESSSLDNEFDLEYDCIYGVDEKIYFAALTEEAHRVKAPGMRMA